MNIDPDRDLISRLTRHRDTCDIGLRNCRDCSIVGDEPTITAITVARIEHSAIKQWIARHHETCVYCGALATDMDHLVPEPWTGPVARRFVPAVPACGCCNGRIGGVPLFTISERAAIVAASLRKKHKKALSIDLPDDDDLRGMSQRFRKQIRSRRDHIRFIHRRLAALDCGGAVNVDEGTLIAA